MESLRASTDDARVYAVSQDGDEATFNAWIAAGANVLTAFGTTFAEKVNHGYRNTGESWLFITGDDVKFHDRWLLNAQIVAGSRHHVVGTNDLGNARVMAGEHGTHLLIRRSYVDEVGASWDGPGVVCHEGYRHWYVDNEIVTAAKQRGVWISAKSSIVEHMHPLFGKGQPDEVYELGQSYAEVDRKTFEERVRAHAR